MTFLPFLAIGLAISLIIMVLLRAWMGWRLWKDWSNAPTQSMGPGSQGTKAGRATPSPEDSGKAEA